MIRALALSLLFVTAQAFAAEDNPIRLDNPQGVGSVRDAARNLSDRILFHKHDGTDGSSNLSSPYILGTIILQSADGSCWSCGPDNAGTWACASTPCP